MFVIVGAVAVTLIAVVAVGMAVGRLENETSPAVYQLEAAVDYIADRLPDEVAARVSYDNVRSVLGWHLDWFATVGLATRHGQELGDPAVSVTEVGLADSDSAVDVVVERSLAVGGPEPVDVVCILDLQMQYLGHIGAIAGVATENDRTALKLSEKLSGKLSGKSAPPKGSA